MNFLDCRSRLPVLYFQIMICYRFKNVCSNSVCCLHWQNWRHTNSDGSAVWSNTARTQKSWTNNLLLRSKTFIKIYILCPSSNSFKTPIFFWFCYSFKCNWSSIRPLYSMLLKTSTGYRVFHIHTGTNVHIICQLSIIKLFCVEEIRWLIS